MASEQGESGTDPAMDSRAGYDYSGGSSTPSVASIVEELQPALDGDVRFDDYSRHLYATDASAYAVLPLGVVYPRTTDDVSEVMRRCAAANIPVLPRGGGTSLAGQAVNEAVVLDFTRYMDEVIEIDHGAKRARAQAGVTIGDLDRAAGEYGLHFGPDPSTAERSALGGAIGNNSTGAHSLAYGKTDAYVEELEVVLADGTITNLGPVSLGELHDRADPAGEIMDRVAATLLSIIKEDGDAVAEMYPNLKRNVSGYNLDLLIEEGETGEINLARQIVGSEGTLAIVTEATVGLEPRPATKAVAVLSYRQLSSALEDVQAVLGHDPAAVEVMDDVLLGLARETQAFEQVVERLPEGTDSFLLVEFFADTPADGRAQVKRLLEDRVGDRAFDALTAYDEHERDQLWRMRKASTPILLSRTGNEKHIAFIEDIAVPPRELPDYVADIQSLLKRHGTMGSVYAHAGPGCVHVRPLINVGTRTGIETMAAIADEATDLAVAYGGSVSGEHGDGRARTQWNRKLYGDELFERFRDLKTAFDPDWLLNPGPVCGDLKMTDHLRFDLDESMDPGFEPALRWDNDKGLAGMVELCHGCGGCRTSQEDGGVMCPTYRAAEEEITATRGRANLLRRAMYGELPREQLWTEEFQAEVLDLCIGCKGCATDCPSEVDMAKLKAELTHAYHQRNGVDRRSKLFANIDRLAALGSATAPLSNWLTSIPGSGFLMERTLGIARERNLPSFSRETFTEWFDARGAAKFDPGDVDREVIIFPDTYTNFIEPEVGRQGVRALEALDVHVTIAPFTGGSGRAAYSTGMLELARKRAKDTVDVLAPLVREGKTVIALEPADAVMIQSDYANLLPDSDAAVVAEGTMGVMEYLDRTDILSGAERAPRTRASMTYHAHCHQKATKRDAHGPAVLRKLGYDVNVLDSGCCGMAGSFGYEVEHYSMSRAIGQVLFDQLSNSPGEHVVAPGVSCRTQIEDGHGATPSHPIEAVARALTGE